MDRAIILLGHGRMASALKESARLIFGYDENIKAVDFLKDSNFKNLDYGIKKAYHDLEDKDHILVMADLAGGSPFTRAGLLLGHDPRVSLLAGVNLSLIYYALSSDIKDRTEFISYILTRARSEMDEFIIP